MTRTRTWDAVLTIDGERTPAAPARLDTMRDTARAAQHEAAEWVREGVATEVGITLYKTTVARGREEARSAGFVWRDGDRVLIDREGC